MKYPKRRRSSSEVTLSDDSDYSYVSAEEEESDSFSSESEDSKDCQENEPIADGHLYGVNDSSEETDSDYSEQFDSSPSSDFSDNNSSHNFD